MGEECMVGAGAELHETIQRRAEGAAAFNSAPPFGSKPGCGNACLPCGGCEAEEGSRK